jgi:spoIIIJ-associated protein
VDDDVDDDETDAAEESTGEAGADDGGSAGSAGSAARKRRRKRGGHRPGEAPSGAERAKAERSAPGVGDQDEEDHQAKGPEVEVDLDRQAEVAVDFLTKLVAEFGVEATVNVVKPDPDTVEIQLTGGDLGILIGPKGQTLVAVQNLTRTAVFNETSGSNGHINVDVSGYRQKRSEALIRFAHQAANHVKTSGERTALEPMSSIDRKIVHDTIADIDGVSTVSEGEEPRRRVVVLPG